MSQRCQNTQNIPVPQGPREQPPAASASAPASPSENARAEIPTYMFEDVLRDPDYYSAKYAATLPLTNRLFRQLRAMRAHPHPGAGPVGQTLHEALRRQQLAQLAARDDEVVDVSAAAMAKRKAIPPIGAEVFVQEDTGAKPYRERILAYVGPPTQNDIERIVAEFKKIEEGRFGVAGADTGASAERSPSPPIEDLESGLLSHPVRYARVMEPEIVPEPSQGEIGYVSDVEDNEDEDDTLCMACAYGRVPSMLDIVERGEWVHYVPKDRDGHEDQKTIAGGVQGWVHESFCEFGGAKD